MKKNILETNIKPYEYISRRDIKKIKICDHDDSTFEIEYNNKIIDFKLKTEFDTNGNIIKFKNQLEDVVVVLLKMLFIKIEHYLPKKKRL